MSFEAMLAAAGGAELGVSEPGRRGFSVPDFIFEDGNNMIGTGAYGLAADPFWAEPNTFLLINADVRVFYNNDGTSYFMFSPGAPGVQTGAEFAASIVNRLNWFFAQTAATWPASKPKRWYLCLRGFDAADCSLKFARHPSDRVDTAAVAYPFMANGRAAVNAWLNTQTPFAALAAELALNNLPAPAGMYCSIEQEGDTWGGGPWWWGMSLADARAGTELFNGTQTLAAWAAQRTLKPDGSAYAAWDGFTNGYNPNVFQFAARYMDAVRVAYAHSISSTIGAAFRSQFGAALPVGEWNVYGNTAAAPVLVRPQQYRFDQRGNYPAGFSHVPHNYGYLLFRANGSVPADPRWETPDNWEAAYGPVSGTAEEKEAQLARRSFREQIQAIRAGFPSADLAPSFSLKFYATDQARAAQLVAGSVVDAVALGAQRVYLWEDGYASSAGYRAALLSLVQNVAARCAASDLS